MEPTETAVCRTKNRRRDKDKPNQKDARIIVEFTEQRNVKHV